MRYPALLLTLLAVMAMSPSPDNYVEPEPTPEPTPEPAPAPPPPPAIDSLNFRSTTGSNVVESPDNTFSIPRCGSGKLGYVVATWPTEPLVGAKMRIEYTMSMSADAQIIGNEYRDRAEPGRMALYMQKDGFDYYQDSYDRGERQWSHARQILVPGPNTFEVPLTYDKWTGGGAEGDKDDYYFKRTMNDINGVGFTLSGAQSAGHGVCMKTGTAKLTITNFTVE